MARCPTNIPEGCSDDGSCCGGGVAGDDRPGVGVCSDSDRGTSLSISIVFCMLPISLSKISQVSCL